MSKERLEEIETHLNRFMTPKSKPCLFRDDAEFIIRYAKEQAEQVHELEYEKAYLERLGKVMQKRIDEQEQQNKRYRKALEIIFNKSLEFSMYEDLDVHNPELFQFSFAVNNESQQALESESDE